MKVLMFFSLFFMSSLLVSGQKLTKELAWAIKYGQIQYLDQWITNDHLDACISTGKSKTYNYLAMSIKLNSMKSLKYFVDRGANIENACEDKTPLMYTAKYDKLDMFNYLIEKGADPSIKVRGKTAMYFARTFHNYEIVRALRNLIN